VQKVAVIPDKASGDAEKKAPAGYAADEPKALTPTFPERV
jgi:hypothetical protein